MRLMNCECMSLVWLSKIAAVREEAPAAPSAGHIGVIFAAAIQNSHTLQASPAPRERTLPHAEETLRTQHQPALAGMRRVGREVNNVVDIHP